MGDTQSGRHFTRPVNKFKVIAVAIGFIIGLELQADPGYIVSLLKQEHGRNRGIHPAAHSYHY
ncbi:MAG: hypothetical protein EGMGGAKC_01155 [Dehalococcoides mccartyi]|nr:hypothetical protein [Dehalococcoides mccartyi]